MCVYVRARVCVCVCVNEKGKRVRLSVTERVPEKEGNMLGP